MNYGLPESQKDFIGRSLRFVEVGQLLTKSINGRKLELSAINL